jgi:hypothetical protein
MADNEKRSVSDLLAAMAHPEPLPTPPGDPESFGLPTAIRREIEHPFDVVGQMIKKTVENPLSPDAIDTYLNVLGAGRVLQGGGITRSVPLPRKWYSPTQAITGEAELVPRLAQKVTYRMRPPVTGQQYLEAFRTATTKGDDVGALNIVRNAIKNDSVRQLIPDALKHPSPYVGREVMGHMMGFLEKPK